MEITKVSNEKSQKTLTISIETITLLIRTKVEGHLLEKKNWF